MKLITAFAIDILAWVNSKIPTKVKVAVAAIVGLIIFNKLSRDNAVAEYKEEVLEDANNRSSAAEQAAVTASRTDAGSRDHRMQQSGWYRD